MKNLKFRKKIKKELLNSLKPKQIFIIEKLWIDNFENNTNNAKGYSPFTFALTEKEAVEFCLKGRKFTNKDCWAIYGELNEFQYSVIENKKPTD